MLRDDSVLDSVLAIGAPKREPVLQMRKSHAVARARPPPTAQPSMTAIVGTAMRSTASITRSTKAS